MAEASPGPPSRAVAELVPADLASQLLALRRDLHRRPELAFEEHETAARLERELRSIGLTDIRRIAGTGVLARVPGGQPGGPVVALRGDIDALPIHEETGLAFRSEKPGLMHACGHDVHASWTVGAAALLCARPARGDVLILLQPAEEVAQGAETVLATGCLDGVAAIFGGHVDRRFAVGQVVAQEGPLAASADLFEIELVGRGAHGARPHEAIDPVVGAASIILALQTVVSRRLPPDRPGVLSIGKVEAGAAANVIPDRALLAGTLRSTDPESRALLRGELEHIVGAVAAAHRLQAKVIFSDSSPPLINPPEAAHWARTAVARCLGPAALVPLGMTNMAGEDFACYLERIPGCFLRIGAREPGGPVIGAHSPRFYAAEEAVLVGAAVLAEIAREASEMLAASEDGSSLRA